MISILSFMLYALSLSSCEKIVWKRGEKLPYKIAPGTYELTLYELEYPTDFLEKERFLEKIQKELITLVTAGTSVMLLLDESFVKDFLHIEQFGVLPEEMFLKKSASQLTPEEREKLFAITGDKGTKLQDILNLQVRYILRILDREREFESNKIYTELYKESLVANISRIRKRLMTIFTSTFISLFVKLDSIYATGPTETDLEYKKYYYKKDLIPRKWSTLGRHFEKYAKKANIFVTDLKPNDFEKILDSELKIPVSSKEILLNNDKFKGYVIRNSVIHLIGGKDKVADNTDYNISFKVQTTTLSDLANIPDTIVLSDLYKTKEEKKKIKDKFKKDLEKLKEQDKVDKEEKEKLLKQKEIGKNTKENKEETNINADTSNTKTVDTSTKAKEATEEKIKEEITAESDAVIESLDKAK